MKAKKNEAAYRTCACGGGQFNLVGFQNSTYLQCANGNCEAPPFPSSQKGHLGRGVMPAKEIEDFKRRLAPRV